MKGLMVWAALAGLVSACGLEVEEPGSGGTPRPASAQPPLPPSMPPPGGFGSGGTEAETRSVAGVGGAGAEESPRAGAGGARRSSPGCLSNEDCGAGLCVNGECQAFCAGDTGCTEGDACVLGLCRPDAGRGWECIDQADCVENEDCVGGSCSRRCLRDGHCADEELVCSFGYCGLLR